MKKTEEFNNILDECLERLLVKGETIEQCLSHYPEHAAELKTLLETTVVTKEALAIQPRPEFKARARYQFQSVLREVKPKRALPFLGWQPQWAVAIAIVLIFLLLGSGTVAASGYSMPDSPLYPVKLVTEQVQLALTASNVNKAKLYAELADRRVIEIVYMVNRGRTKQIEKTAQRLNNHLAMIASLPLAETVVKRAPPAEAPVTFSPPPADAGKRDLPVRARAPRSPQPAEVEKEDLPAKAPAPSPSQAEAESKHVPQPTTAKGKLKILLKHNAVKHPEALRAILEKAPKSAKPALRRAIDLSQSSYNKAINALD